MKRRCIAVTALAVLACSAPGIAAANDPEIYSINPSEGAAGDTIQIKGRALRETTLVIFAVGRTSKPAKFKALSDKELEVVVPDYYLPEASATVAVITRKGATVGIPPSAVRVDGASRQSSVLRTFCHVLKEGVVRAANGVSLIEDGGAVMASSQAPMHFVKSGGLLDTFSNAAGLIIHERGALFGKYFQQETLNSYEWHLKRIQVPHISGSLGIDPFLLKAPEQATGAAKAAPHIRSVNPPRASYGDVITLQGQGFLGMSRVFFDIGKGSQEFLPAGFKIVSDRQLRVVVPDQSQPHNHEVVIMVVNPKGMCVTLPPRRRTLRASNTREMGQLFLPNENGIWFKPGGGSIQLVEKGQRVGNGLLVFAKNGAKISPFVPRVMFYEPAADVPLTAMKKAKNTFAVDKIMPSEMDLFRMKLPWE